MNNASKPGVKTQIVDMSINGSGVRDTVRGHRQVKRDVN
ncbi:IS1-like element transposase [Rickettsia endosymbiont of Cantharis rufa]